MENKWSEICVSDKTGNMFFKTIASPMSIMSEIRNLSRHVENAKSHPSAYKFLDADSAYVMVDGEKQMTDDEILAELGV